MFPIFDINNICVTPLGYPLSYIELIGIVTGLVSVWCAARANIWTWPVGLVNVTAFFFLFYQVRLYSDVLLQVFFFVTTCYGWYYWRRQDVASDTGKITLLTHRARMVALAVLFAGTVALGYGMSRVHIHLPTLFPEPASFPYPDALTTVLSVAATFLLAQRKIESWVLWITVDVVSIGLYAMKEIVFTSLLYCVFLVIASFGLVHWRRVYHHESRTCAREIHADS